MLEKNFYMTSQLLSLYRFPSVRMNSEYVIKKFYDFLVYKWPYGIQLNNFCLILVIKYLWKKSFQFLNST